MTKPQSTRKYFQDLQKRTPVISLKSYLESKAETPDSDLPKCGSYTPLLFKDYPEAETVPNLKDYLLAKVDI